MTIGARLYRLENQVNLSQIMYEIINPSIFTIYFFRWVKLTKSWMGWLKCCRQSSRCKNFNWLLLHLLLQLIQIKQQQHWWLLITTLLQIPLIQLLIHPLKKIIIIIIFISTMYSFFWEFRNTNYLSNVQ